MVALGRYGGSKARTMNIWEVERRIRLHVPNLIWCGRNGLSGGDKNRFLPIQLDYEQEQLGNQPDDEPYVRNDGIHWVDVIIATTISQWRSQLCERTKLPQNWRDVEMILSEAIYSRSERACECISRDVVKVRHITTETYTCRDIPYCHCTTSASRLISSGFFPSSPGTPRTLFSLKLLRTLHEQSTSYSCSKEAWAGGLRAAFEADNKMVLPDFSRPVYRDIAPYSWILIYTVIQLRDAYHHWVATTYQVDTMLESAIEEADQGTPWKQEQLVTVCPPRFNFSDQDEDRTICITMDAHMQDAWLERHTL